MSGVLGGLRGYSEKKMKKGPENCVRCGKCLPSCPSYQFFLKESYSPRGRNFLFSKDLASQSYEFCLYCERCRSICPHKLSFPEFYWDKLFSDKGLPLPYLKDSLSLLSLLPQGSRIFKKWEVKEILPFTRTQGDYYIYLSCGLKHLYPEALHKFLKTFSQTKLHPQIPMEQDCCGILYLSLRAIHNLKKCALNKLRIFSEKKPVITFCATCFWVLKKVYPKLFENTDKEKDFKELSERTYFFTEFIIEKIHYTFKLENKSKILYHFPCHLKDPLTSQEKYLKNIIDLRDFCCGSAKATLWIRGFQEKYSSHWKRELIGKDTIATACTGCYLNFSFLLKRPPQIKHWMEFIK